MILRGRAAGPGGGWDPAGFSGIRVLCVFNTGGSGSGKYFAPPGTG